VSGPIRELDADFNTPVKKGQRLAKIDPAPFEMKVRQAEANLASARASVLKAEADLALKRLTRARSTELAGRHMLAQSSLDSARSDVAQAEAQLALQEASVRQAEAGVEEARINLGYTEIVSPVDGVVVSRNVDVGQTVAASFQTPTLFQVAEDLTKMQVNANVSESDIGALTEGQSAEFSVDAYPGRVFRGRVSQVRNAPTTLQNVVTYDVVIDVDNSDLALKPGMTATVTVVTRERDDALRVPLRALRFRPAKAGKEAETAAGAADEKQAVVWRVDGKGALQRVPVRLGLRDERYAEVVEGSLTPGDPLAVAYPRTATSAPEQPPPFVQGRRVR
jgi:HlyD family secretion protein